MEITVYNHHSKAPSSPAPFSPQPKDAVRVSYGAFALIQSRQAGLVWGRKTPGQERRLPVRWHSYAAQPEEILPSRRFTLRVTLSCYQRLSLLASQRRRDLFLRVLEAMHRAYDMVVVGYVVMPEHLHLLVSEPERQNLSTVIKALKESVSRRVPRHLRIAAGQGGAGVVATSNQVTRPPRTVQPCSRFCGGESTQKQEASTTFNKRRATDSIKTSCDLQISTDFSKLRNLVRDQGVAGSNPVSPTNPSQRHTDFCPTG